MRSSEAGVDTLDTEINTAIDAALDDAVRFVYKGENERAIKPLRAAAAHAYKSGFVRGAAEACGLSVEQLEEVVDG